MAGSTWAPGFASPARIRAAHQRHAATVRITHWVTALCVFALLLSGLQIVISHPRFYWGEIGNVNTSSLFDLPIPASRSAVKTGYNFVLPDQNGWSRSLHFQAAWLLVIAGLLYVAFGLRTHHFRRNLLPATSDLSLASFAKVIRDHLRLKPPGEDYNLLQRITYLGVIFLLFPLMICTGLAMSPAITSAFPAIVTVFGGQQSARTIHFFGTVLITLFVLAHISMVWLAGFRNRVGAMITGNSVEPQERP